jgi:hypothetical protein
MVYLPLGACKSCIQVCTWFAHGLHGISGTVCCLHLGDDSGLHRAIIDPAKGLSNKRVATRNRCREIAKSLTTKSLLLLAAPSRREIADYEIAAPSRNNLTTLARPFRDPARRWPRPASHSWDPVVHGPARPAPTSEPPSAAEPGPTAAARPLSARPLSSSRLPAMPARLYTYRLGVSALI